MLEKAIFQLEDKHGPEAEIVVAKRAQLSLFRQWQEPYINAIDKLSEMIERPDAVRLLKPVRFGLVGYRARLVFCELFAAAPACWFAFSRCAPYTDCPRRMCMCARGMFWQRRERKRLRTLTDTMKRQAMKVSEQIESP